MSKHDDYREDTKVTQLVPNVDVYERKDEVVLIADLPGVNDKGLDVTIDRDNLGISGKTAARGDSGSTYEYTRSFTLSDRVDKSGIKAGIKDGVLTLNIPFAEEAKARKVPITYN